jgi:tRNA (guanine10-N2)-dimethyltransferase
METYQYLYTLNYPLHEKELCDLEIRALFNLEFEEKVIISNIKIDPSISPYLRTRLQMSIESDTYEGIHQLVLEANIMDSQFLVKYAKTGLMDPSFYERRVYCKDLGLLIHGLPSFDAPNQLYGITVFKGVWYFGELIEKDNQWKKHQDKPHPYSSSLGINMAKALVNIASNGNKNRVLIDPCCGVGTVLLEAAYSNYQIVGWDINPLVADDARKNLSHYQYDISVTKGDISEISSHYDAAIIDLPYGIFTSASDEERLKILQKGKVICDQLVVVSQIDIQDVLLREDLKIIDSCLVGKPRKSDFYRYVYVCLTENFR